MQKRNKFLSFLALFTFFLVLVLLKHKWHVAHKKLRPLNLLSLGM